MSSNTIVDALGGSSGNIAKSDIVSGVVPAIVTNLKDPKKLGRIKVNFPWLAKNSESDWIRVISLWAGKDRGIFFLPEVGDEVMVIFQKGNINSPYVAGSMWSNKAKPPEQNADGKNNIKIIKSRCGHTITFDDNTEKKKEKLEIKTNAGHQVLLDDTKGKEKIVIKDKTGKNKITIDSVKGAITIQSAKTINLKSTNINIEAKSKLNVKAALSNHKTSGITTIKGSLVKIN